MEGELMSETGDVAAAVARLFDAATAEEARSLRGLTATWARLAGRSIEVEEVDDLEPGVCGQWCSGPTHDTLRLRRGLPSKDWTHGHELGHVVLGHQGRPVADGASSDVAVADTALVEYMLNRGGDGSEADSKQEDQAEAFAGLLMARMRTASRSASPGIHARLSDTLG
jgi:hypothetical protein